MGNSNSRTKLTWYDLGETVLVENDLKWGKYWLLTPIAGVIQR